MSYPGDPYGGALPRETAVSTAEADLIDLDVYRNHAAVQLATASSYGQMAAGYIQDLIAAVEALREQVATLETVDSFLVATAEKNLARAESAEARVAELEAALEEVRPYFEGEHHYDHPSCKILRSTLQPVKEEHKS